MKSEIILYSDLFSCILTVSESKKGVIKTYTTVLRQAQNNVLEDRRKGILDTTIIRRVVRVYQCAHPSTFSSYFLVSCEKFRSY